MHIKRSHFFSFLASRNREYGICHTWNDQEEERVIEFANDKLQSHSSKFDDRLSFHSVYTRTVSTYVHFSNSFLACLCKNRVHTLLVLVNFCPVLSKLFTRNFVYKNFLYFWQKLSTKIKSRLNGSPNLGLFLLKYIHFWLTISKSFLKTQNGEKFSLYLVFIGNFWQNIKSFNEQNCMSRIHYAKSLLS